MILPSKYIAQDRALLTVGGCILGNLQKPKTVSALWEEFTRPDNVEMQPNRPMAYDWFVLALDLLYLLGAIEIKGGLIARSKK